MKAWAFFEKINKMDKPLARLTKKKRESTPLIKITNKRGDHNQHYKNTNNYKKILWKTICQQIGQPGRNKFLETYKLLNLRQGEIENLNRPMTSKEIESIQKRKKNPINKSPGPDSLTGEFYQTF